ncbi:SIR2 family protein [Streptosporangiaceae bacterium NEAU-GS5]|nr:SIR2 family protein [Streptosporangiaceae bacterium NEAU-GS5]
MNESDWERLLKQLHRGDCTPLLGAGACFGRLPIGAELCRHFADQYEYPFADRNVLHRVMQYAAFIRDDPVEFKIEVCEYLKGESRQSLPAKLDPHSTIAEFPIKTLITTNYDNFMVEALRRAQGGYKSPVALTARWWELGTTPTDLDVPTAEKPLVYHLHGNWDEPRSLVLTEDDYIAYMVNMLHRGDYSQASPLPFPVLDAMLNRPLLFIGYSLQDWNFWVLFRGLLRAISDTQRRRHISVQLLPDLDMSVAEAEVKAKKYLERYLDRWHISIYIGSADDFFGELRNKM